MDEHRLYFAYGSNLALARFKARVSSAIDHGLSCLPGHRLAFHKVSQSDGSAKCDAEYTGNSRDEVHGILYWIHQGQLGTLDRIEGNGVGYQRRKVTVLSPCGRTCEAESYFATVIDKSLRPFDWYKEHVLRGALSRNLPEPYVRMIDAVPAVADPDPFRRDRELAVYLA
jgi:gamma-glutamylcyclotransferase (GGCT)/AIG2-like uncharacterized protein YtfP